MKPFAAIVILFIGTLIPNANAQESASEAWQDLLNKPGLAEYFSGMYNTLGIEVEETGERFTVHHKGDHFEITEGANPKQVDYFVTLGLHNISNMHDHGDDGKITPYESYRIMSVLFTPLTQVALKNEVFTKRLPQILAGIENHVHVYLHSPKNEEYVAHTLVYQNDTWFVVPGIHGDAKRRFDLKPGDAIEYQRKLFDAMETDTKKGWRKFKKWYVKWRKGVSEDL